ncbi:YdeI/OmpD-associated family protein [Oxalobacteraceae bacterium R-40]|uniref:YdeI/OmpD-associated family protein n=1 Tax=Keguizhuia sedimenti TaxID=3064264 RepID=A0ABU1BP57_9BURK|nr:YdeI/OmpD-associated family protein [Oxalobacteraceae bacterium R-40]
MPVELEPEPDVPADLREALEASPESRTTWNGTTTIARLGWIHWIASAKQEKTRKKRINDACEMLALGEKRVCCFDPSGYYSKAFSTPQIADEYIRMRYKTGLANRLGKFGTAAVFLPKDNCGFQGH